ncbi:MAG: acylphosphatase [Bacteroidia bacterium]|nr:acylphosphatase [Bacteroidia bacterium]NNF30113.1 acylphosphatase [Flavobacteriaceae bacterium]MBT8274991.1 acylphosphatase [Bacteroidia bacterium]NNJ80589.1 acylphosphatase [Flavobacteriaceae bacterium]NNK55524.1 acylphosphatase [Flavobacteriaceae bacterium]
MIKHINLRVYGKVQGVWYRKSTQEKAITLGITGFVKNVEDGSVYIEAEGPDTPLKKLIEWCKIGPQHAVVTNVEIEESASKSFKSFDIAY